MRTAKNSLVRSSREGAAPCDELPQPSRSEARAVFLWRWPLLLIVLGVSLGLAGSSAVRNSVTVDELAHLPMGIRVWRDGLFNAGSATAPLPSMLAALPVVVFTSARLDPIEAARPTDWPDGFQFAADNRAHYHEYFLLARLVTMLAPGADQRTDLDVLP